MRALLSSMAVVLSCVALARATEPAMNPAEAGPAFQFVGEYVGSVAVWEHGVWRSTRIGLQVVALGDGRFEGVEYLHGLPGAGWNGVDKAVLPGKMVGDVVRLSAVPAEVVVDGYTALVGVPGQTPAFGTLTRINRASPTLGWRAPPEATVLFAGGLAKGLKDVELTETGLLSQGAATSEPYSDFTLHVEYQLPFMPGERNQARGNSGIYLQRRYEIQILDSFGSDAVFNGAGSIYRSKSPDVNMSLPPLAWQTFDIRFRPARFEHGEKMANARLTVWHNGVKIHEDYEIPNKTGAGKPEGPSPLPILFQDHNDPVRFQNIWIVDHTQHPMAIATPRIVDFAISISPATAGLSTCGTL